MRRLIACVLLAAPSGCSSEDPAPSVAVVRADPGEIDPADDAADDLTITLDYRDGDGDLGGGVAEVTDCRADDLVIRLDLPPIASAEAVAEGVPIEGTLDVVVADIGVIEPAAAAPAACAELGVAAPRAGEAVFCVVLTDAAGHAGAGDCTPPVAILSD